MRKHSKRNPQEVSAGSMADIAFLLLIFFLVSTTMAKDTGIQILLAPDKDRREQQELHDSNVLKVLINARGKLLVEDEPLEIRHLRQKAKEFIDNHGKDAQLSESPQMAVVALKSDRATLYPTYLRVLDEIKAAYNELRADFMGISLEEYQDFKIQEASPEELQSLDQARKAYPLRISESEPSDIGN